MGKSDLYRIKVLIHCGYCKSLQFLDNYAGFCRGVIDYLETGESLPANTGIIEVLKAFDSAEIHNIWQKALERKNTDPEGAITISKTMLESTCKHILFEKGIEYNKTRIELPELYKTTAHALNIAPDQHTEQIFKQILGGGVQE